MGGRSSYYNQTGSFNVAIGYEAGHGVSGFNNNRNVFIGHQAGHGITIGNDNTFIGYLSGFNISSGASNICIGQLAGYNITTNDHNTFLGYSAGRNTTTGSSNIAIGYQAYYYNQTGQNNFVAGYQAGYGVSGNSYANNVFIGYQAGYNSTTSSDNIVIGQSSGLTLTSGTNNIVLGLNADVSVGTQSNTCIIGDIAGSGNELNVGIGTNNPTESLDVNGQIVGSDPWTVHTTVDTGFTASKNRKYMVDTSNNTANITMTMPDTTSIPIGTTVTVTDMKGSFSVGGSQNVITDDATELFNGVAQTWEFDVANSTTQMVWTGGTYGWKVIVLSP